MDPEFMPLSSEGELITKHERDQAVCVASRSQRLTLATKNYCKEGRRAKEIVIRTTKKKKSGFENRQVLLLLKKKKKRRKTSINSDSLFPLFPLFDCALSGEKASILASQELQNSDSVNAVTLLVLTYTKVREALTGGRKVNNTQELFVLVFQN